MKTSSKFLILIAGLLALTLQNCQNCDDCSITPAPKQVSVVNSSGKDLMFGASPVYNPDNIVIKNNLGETVEFFANASNTSLDFTFTTSANTYFIKLNTTDTDTILFGYGKDKHIDCCNEFDVTASTTVNGKSVSNDDKITIVK